MTETADAKTKDVEILLGKPSKAIIALMVPMTIAMIVQMANNLIDAVWVAGLGESALAAVGFVFPLFFIIMGVGNGVGIGASAAIARHIGRGDKESAEKTISQAFYLMLVGGAVTTALLLLFAEPILYAFGAGDIMGYTMGYAVPIFVGSIPIMMSGLLSNFLRAEGAAKRSMNVMIVGALINIVLDPIFIYTFGWGMAGAAWATVLSMIVPLLMTIYWYFIKKDTYLKVKLRNFKFDWNIDKDILRVGIPSSMEFFIMSAVAIVMNILITWVDGTTGVAIYSSGWRIIQMVMIPLMALSGAVVPVFGVWYGSRKPHKIREAYVFSMKLGLVLMVALCVLLYIFAPWAVMLFTYSDATVSLSAGMVELIRVACVFLPVITWGFVSVGLFQALGMGGKSLVSTLVRNALQLPFCFIAAMYIGTLTSMWWALACSEIIGTVFMGIWGLLVLRSLLKEHGGSRSGGGSEPASE
jgi:putative MATE family efflux protein